jgi:hypothetical protein
MRPSSLNWLQHAHPATLQRRSRCGNAPLAAARLPRQGPMTRSLTASPAHLPGSRQAGLLGQGSPTSASSCRARLASPIIGPTHAHAPSRAIPRPLSSRPLRPCPPHLHHRGRGSPSRAGSATPSRPLSAATGVNRSSAASGRITASSSAARRLRQRPTHSRAFWLASHAPTYRTPAGSAAASC